MRLSSKIFILIFICCVSATDFTKAQTVLNSDGSGTAPGNTYELINSFFAPGYNAVESPDQTSGTYPGTHAEFGRHIVEVFDTEANKYVFEFYSHVANDNDISTGKTDRQRVEIKTYAASPASMKGIIGETIVYKWRFKIPVGFQPSSYFTHIHQIKAVDGDDSDPIFTLTPRKGTPNKLELIYVLNSNSGTSKLAILNLSDFEGNWVEATETIKVGEGSSGTYAIIIKKVSDGSTLLNYSNNSIQTIRPVFSDPLISAANTFIRPKWGIYRGLTMPSDLRDESIRFSDFSITELSALAVQIGSFKAVQENNAVKLKWTTASEQNNLRFDIEKSTDGKAFLKIGSRDGFGNSNTANDYFFNDQNPSQGLNYYRLKQIDFNGTERMIDPIAINLGFSTSDMEVSYDQMYSTIFINMIALQESHGNLNLYNLTGQKIATQNINLNQGLNHLTFAIPNFVDGVYVLSYNNGVQIINKKIIKQ